MLIRHGQPSKLDHSPKGTVCKVIKPLSEDCTIYVQINEADNDPRWEYVGEFSPDTEYLIPEKVKTVLSFNYIQD